jgi:hypothetical protein
MTIPLALALSVLLQQPQAPQRPAQTQATRDSAIAATRQAIRAVGQSVAEMRNLHDALRRAVFNATDAVVLQRAHQMRESCRALTTAARDAAGHVCRSCFSAAVQPAMNGYRGVLPDVGRVGTRCVAQLDRALRVPDSAAALRRDIFALARTVVNGMFPYEERLLAVRRALGLVQEPPEERRR